MKLSLRTFIPVLLIVLCALAFAAPHAHAATAIFGNNVMQPTVDSGDQNSVDAVKFTMPTNQSGTAQSASVYIASPVSAAPQNLFQVALYTDASGAPGSLVASTPSQAIVPDAWNTAPINAQLASGATYWLAYNTNGVANDANNWTLGAGSAGQEIWKAVNFGTWPATFGSVDGRASMTAGIYLTYNASSTGSGTPPTASLTANPTSITAGSSTMLTWNSTNATSCTGSGFTAGSVSGTTSVSPAQTITYSITCTGSGGSAGASATVTVTGGKSVITLPDMQLKVPTNLISIGTNSSNGDRQLQFTHITWDAGTGPFEIDPTYDSKTGTASFTQAIYNSPSAGTWVFDHSEPVAVTGIFDSPSDYQFPLTKFTLNTVNPDGSLGAVVATSPKKDYCITGDTYVGGVPNSPNSTFIPASNCDNPNLPLGWSVGWGDEYDQTDSGQPIDLTGVPDGTYILHATVDPDHVLTESETDNNVTDTLLQIAGSKMTVLSQTTPTSTPPVVSMTAPAAGSDVSGQVLLQASATSASSTISSVQFLLDGLALGAPTSTAPYSYLWTVGSTAPGSNTLSARAVDANGESATSPAITVTVLASTSTPPDTTPPTVSIINPTAGETVSGTSTPVAANATDNVAVASVQFFLDGKPLGSTATTSPYSISWDTTTVATGTHALMAQATDTSGNVGTSTSISVDVENPAPPMTCFVLQAQVSAHARGSVTTASFHTAMAGELLVAFVSADGPNRSGSQTATVSGAGLTWHLVKRANASFGDSEVWEATSTSVLSNATVTSKLSNSSYMENLTVIAMEGVDGIGASAAASAASGAPSLQLPTTATTSLVFAVGNDWDNAIGRTLPNGWVMLNQYLSTATGDTFWSQYTNTPTTHPGEVVNVGDTAPTSDQWNLVGVELIGSGD